MKQWKRVTGPDLHPQNQEIHERNLNIFNSELFKKACALAGIEATMRQASKFRRGLGKAFQFRNAANQ